MNHQEQMQKFLEGIYRPSNIVHPVWTIPSWLKSLFIKLKYNDASGT